jgi:hypothetical protein
MPPRYKTKSKGKAKGGASTTLSVPTVKFKRSGNFSKKHKASTRRIAHPLGAQAVLHSMSDSYLRGRYNLTGTPAGIVRQRADSWRNMMARVAARKLLGATPAQRQLIERHRDKISATHEALKAHPSDPAAMQAASNAVSFSFGNASTTGPQDVNVKVGGAFHPGFSADGSATPMTDEHMQEDAEAWKGEQLALSSSGTHVIARSDRGENIAILKDQLHKLYPNTQLAQLRQTDVMKGPVVKLKRPPTSDLAKGSGAKKSKASH